MKKLMIAALIVFSGLLYTGKAFAQLRINVNIGDQPAWAPEGSDEASYYYIPDMDIYYDVPAHQFVYLQNRRWVRSSALPAQYRKYDLYKVHKVPVNEANAYRNHRKDREQYAQYMGKSDQTSLRDSHDEKYKNNHDNWNNNRFKKGQGNGHDNGNRGQGHGHDNDKH